MTEKVKKAKAPAKAKAATKAKAPAKPRKTTATKAKTVGPALLAKPSREEVEKLAHTFWEQRGCQHGFDEQDWLRAEEALHKQTIHKQALQKKAS